MNILISTDSHKDFASSQQVGEWIKCGLREVSSDFNINVLPIGDGGEGTIEAILTAQGGQVISCKVHDPLFRPRLAKIGMFNDAERTAVIEIAEASGSAVLAPHERDTMLATSFGTGEMIHCVLDRNCRHIIVGLGGSIVSDGGMGMAQALGARFYDTEGIELSPENNKGFNVLSLHRVAKIDMGNQLRRVHSVNVSIAADVRTKLLGPQGQAAIFGPQKGATPEQIEFIDEGLRNWSIVLHRTFGKNFDVEFAGAAGGLGAGLAAFLGGRLELGIDLVLREIDFEEKLNASDLVITGEGRLDKTSLHGKASCVIATKAQEMGKAVVGLFGVVLLDSERSREFFDKIIRAFPSGIQSDSISIEKCKIGIIQAGKRAGEWIRARN